MENLEFDEIINSIKLWLESSDRLYLGKPQAAVLVPLIMKDGAPHIILTLRSNNLNKHSGQIAFPGGKVDPVDTDIYSTALREAEEEIGINRKEVNILGLFDDFFTPYYNSITPVIAIMPRPKYKISEDEIEEILEVPISDLLNPRIYHSEIWNREGTDYEIHFYNWYDKNQGKTHEIWGATATVIYKILKIIA